MRGRLVLLFAVASLAGCGYHTLGSAAHMPDTVHTLAVPIFKNKSQLYHTEVPMTQAVVHEFSDRTRLHVTPAPSEDADATVSGTILSESVQPLTYRTQTTAVAATVQWGGPFSQGALCGLGDGTVRVFPYTMTGAPFGCFLTPNNGDFAQLPE